MWPLWLLSYFSMVYQHPKRVYCIQTTFFSRSISTQVFEWKARRGKTSFLVNSVEEEEEKKMSVGADSDEGGHSQLKTNQARVSAVLLALIGAAIVGIQVSNPSPV